MRNLFVFVSCILICACGNRQKQSTKYSPKTIMAVFAHPDDELDVSPLLTRLASQGHKVYLAIATKGDMGVRDHAKIPSGDSLTNVRARETACTCEILGIEPPILLGLSDGRLTNWDALALLRKRLDSVITIYKPDIVITWGPDGGSGHPDHRMVGAVTTEIFQSGQSTRFYQLLYTAIPTEHWKEEPAYQSNESISYHKNYKTVEKKHLPIRIRCSEEENQVARKAMRCYTSQYPPNELDDNELWMKNMNKDTVYLRPYENTGYMSSNIFQ